MTDVEHGDGYCVPIKDGRVHVDLVKRWLDDCIRVEAEATVSADEWTHLLVTYDGSRVASGIAVYLDGEPVRLQVNYDFINQTFAAKAPLRIGAGGGPQSRFHGLIDDVKIYPVTATTWRNRDGERSREANLPQGDG